ncbi:MAG: hypothetical protein ILP18_00960, partial [Treponema sp.]|nr:hypothetical protein [Treponema sp.]
NANDGTCEGIAYGDIPAFSVQFHPEACGGPHDTNFLFDDFMRMIDRVRRGAAGNGPAQPSTAQAGADGPGAGRPDVGRHGAGRPQESYGEKGAAGCR